MHALSFDAHILNNFGKNIIDVFPVIIKIKSSKYSYVQYKKKVVCSRDVPGTR